MQFTDPLEADEPKFLNADMPKICPQCGREAAALVKTEYDSMGKFSGTADVCSTDLVGRGSDSVVGRRLCMGYQTDAAERVQVIETLKYLTNA